MKNALFRIRLVDRVEYEETYTLDEIIGFLGGCESLPYLMDEKGVINVLASMQYRLWFDDNFRETMRLCMTSGGGDVVEATFSITIEDQPIGEVT